MLPDPTAGDRRPSRKRPVTAGLSVVVAIAFVIVLLLRHDWWNWSDARPLLVGFLPIGLWWQALVSILAAAMMWLAVTLAWPDHLEDVAHEPPDRPDRRH